THLLIDAVTGVIGVIGGRNGLRFPEKGDVDGTAVQSLERLASARVVEADESNLLGSDVTEGEFGVAFEDHVLAWHEARDLERPGSHRIEAEFTISDRFVGLALLADSGRRRDHPRLPGEDQG